MNILRSFFGNREPSPDWAITLDREGYLRFVAILRRRLEREQRAYVVETRAGCVYPADDPEQQFNLQNLAQICARNGGRDWVEIIDEHVTRLLRWESISAALPHNFEDARHLLLPRVVPPSPTVDQAVAVGLCPGLYAFVFVNLPDAVIGVTRDVAERWGQSPDDLYAISLENLWRSPRYDPVSYPHSEGATFAVADDQNYFVASHVLQLNRYLFPEPEWGALLAIPSCHTFLYEPIEGRVSSLTVQRLSSFALQGYVTGPGSITPRLFWSRRGQIVALDVEDHSRIVGPDEVKGTPLISY
jgi:hypothetical protein